MEMKTRIEVVLLLIVVLTCLTAFAQHGFEAVTPDSPVNLQLSADSVWVRGHWVALDKQSSLTGPSVSEITCERNQSTCEERRAEIAVVGNSFNLTPDYVEYKVERWTGREIVASNVTGVCRVRNVLKFDLVEKRVYAMQTLSEPLDDKLPQMAKDFCKAIGMNLELKDRTLWVKK